MNNSQEKPIDNFHIPFQMDVIDRLLSDETQRTSWLALALSLDYSNVELACQIIGANDAQHSAFYDNDMVKGWHSIEIYDFHEYIQDAKRASKLSEIENKTEKQQDEATELRDYWEYPEYYRIEFVSQAGSMRYTFRICLLIGRFEGEQDEITLKLEINLHNGTF